jgi:hypothetical protein
MIRVQDKIIKHISLVKFKDPRVIEKVVYHPMFFARQKMTDPDDYRPIRIRYFGVFVGKFMRNKEMHKKLTHAIKILKARPDLISIFVEPSFTNDLDARKYVVELFSSNQKESFLAVHDALCKAMET